MSDHGSEADADVAAMDRLQSGDDLALNELIIRWTPRVHAFLFRLLDNTEDARDLTQETFVALYSSCARYRASARFSSWLFGIASNLARQRMRWRKRHPEIALDLQEEECASMAKNPFTRQNPATVVDAAERAAAVRTAILSLPSSMRELILLSEYEGLTQKEIAKIAGCTVKAVETRLYRARALLRKALAAFLIKT